MKAVYIHIPFCKKICSYCDFCKLLINDAWVNDYLKALAYEIDEYYNKDLVKSIYIGGGTPSALNIRELKMLFEIIKIFNKAPNCEFTFECNLSDINDILLKILKENGVNRISIGIESFNERMLDLMNRQASFNDALNKINLCRYYGINNINIDLIYGIEGQTLNELKEDVKLFLKLPVTHISTYSLIVEDNTVFKMKGIGNVLEELEYKMYTHIVDSLKSKGFKHYEVSNFSKEGFESIHNLTYWHNEEYYGFGLNASGFIGSIRYTNTDNIKKYIAKEYDRTTNILTTKQMMDDEIMLGFRLMNGIDIHEFNDKYQTDIYNEYPIQALINNRDLILKDNRLYINPNRIYVMNNILLKML
ncbi:MAG: radical SAM family heme chaperone HemW [Bacilli bacterium]|nr:radical SAM family heme chaperone HemW [Bacilli bacterium]